MYVSAPSHMKVLHVFPKTGNNLGHEDAPVTTGFKISHTTFLLCLLASQKL